MITRFDPFVDFARLSQDFLRYPDALSGAHDPHAARADGPSRFVPAVDVTEEKDGYLVTAELPGLKAEDIHINVEKNVLTLSGERKLEKEEKDAKVAVVRLERGYGAFTRSFVLPDTADGEKVEANLADGLLKVRIPKRASAQPRKITVKVS